MDTLREKKTFDFKVSTLNEGTIAGAAAGIGNLDRGGDVIFPSFFKDVLKGFLSSGFVAIGHDWAALPVAMPTMAREQGKSLYSEAVFHTTPAAQDARTVCIERMNAGLSVGLSIGFSVAPGGYAYFNNGKELIDYAKKNGYDMSLFDVKEITSCKSQCRGLLEAADLFEWSIVTIPMNPQANMTEAKKVNPVEEKTSPPIPILIKTNENSSFRIDVKSTYLGDIERNTACQVIQTVMYALMRKIYRQLYTTDASVVDVNDLLKDLPEACDEARDIMVKILPELIRDLDIEDIREQSSGYYDYYASPPGEHKLDNVDTEAKSLRDLASSIKSVRDFEDFLRDAGFARNRATLIASKGYNSLRDSESESKPEDSKTEEIPVEETDPDVLAKAALAEKKERLMLELQGVSINT